MGSVVIASSGVWPKRLVPICLTYMIQTIMSAIENYKLESAAFELLAAIK